MPYYETVFIARQDVSAPQVEALADTFSQIIDDRGGKVATREIWGLRPLAYRIRKHRKGHYVLFNIDAPAGAIHEMERQMRLNEDILRHLTVRVDALEEGASAMMQMRAGRSDDRPRRDDRYRGNSRPAEQTSSAAEEPQGENNKTAATASGAEDAAPEETGAKTAAPEEAAPEDNGSVPEGENK